MYVYALCVHIKPSECMKGLHTSSFAGSLSRKGNNRRRRPRLCEYINVRYVYSTPLYIYYMAFASVRSLSPSPSFVFVSVSLSLSIYLSFPISFPGRLQYIWFPNKGRFEWITQMSSRGARVYYYTVYRPYTPWSIHRYYSTKKTSSILLAYIIYIIISSSLYV